MGKKGKEYSPRFQFQGVLEVLKGDRGAVEIARAHDLHLTTIARWKREFLENGAAVFGRNRGYLRKRGPCQARVSQFASIIVFLSSCLQARSDEVISSSRHYDFSTTPGSSASSTTR